MQENVIASSDKDALALLRACISPVCFWPVDRITTDTTAWLQHVPFAFWLVGTLRPKTFVELGTHGGCSYFAVCQAVQRMELETSCYAIDTWKGDEHAGFYGEDVFREVCNYNDQRFSAFSTLIRSTFDEASQYFIEGTIDLLHIDGRHFYDDVKHDFETWRSKLSDRAVVLLHDINVRERDFGVFKLWDELRQSHPHFEFSHGHGFGIIGVGKELSGQILKLFTAGMDAEATTHIRRAYSRLGAAVSFEVRAEQFQRAASEREAKVAALKGGLAEREAKVAALKGALAERDAHVATLNQTVAERNGELAALKGGLAERDSNVAVLDQKLAELKGTLAERDVQVTALDQAVSERNRELAALHASTSWRITAPLRLARRLLRHRHDSTPHTY